MSQSNATHNSVSDNRFWSFVESRISIYGELMKAKIVGLEIVAAAIGFFIGQPLEREISWSALLLTLVGIFLLGGAAAMFNQIQERHLDSQMPRTASRPLPSGRISAVEATIVASFVFVCAMGILWAVNVQLVWAGLIAAASYNILYTLWWKRKWAFAAVPGAIPGALPILMGYGAASGNLLDSGAVFLFALLFFWQMPHFWSLALRYEDDYRQGDIPTLPVVVGSKLTIYQISLWCLAYISIAIMAPLFLDVGAIYVIVAAAVSFKLVWELRKYNLAFRSAESDRHLEDEDARKAWTRYFVWINLSMVFYILAIALDYWSVYAQVWFV